MIKKKWAVTIINSTHFKTTGCYLAYSLGEKKTNKHENVSTPYYNTLHHNLHRNPLVDKEPKIKRGVRGKRPSHILGAPESASPTAHMSRFTLCHRQPVLAQMSGVKNLPLPNF